MNFDYLKLEGDKEYLVLDTVSKDNNNYLLLVDPENEGSFCIRKVTVKNNQEFVEKLQTKEEFQGIIELLYQKYKGDREQ